MRTLETNDWILLNSICEAGGFGCGEDIQDVFVNAAKIRYTNERVLV